jgi:hypothetical protein
MQVKWVITVLVLMLGLLFFSYQGGKTMGSMSSDKKCETNRISFEKYIYACAPQCAPTPSPEE